MIVFCTPMYGGQCTVEFFRSALGLRGDLVAAGVGNDWLTVDNESLIQRARNTAVARFLFDPSLKDYTHFMFIDADIEFQTEDVQKLYNLDKDVACAAYPMKKEGSHVSAWIDGKLTEQGDLDKLKEPVTVDYAGTGFLLIKRSVFERMAEQYPEMEHTEGKVGKCHAFFDTGVVDGFYCSEDYWFCRKWREMGGEIWLDPTIRLGHVGRKKYL